MAGIGRLFLLSWLFLVGCQPLDAENSYDLVFQTIDAEVADKVASALDRSGIDYNREDDTTIRYSSKDYEEFTKISRSVILTDLPSDRSVMFYSPILKEALIKEFEKEGINFERKYRNNEEWIIWSQSDTEKAKEIVDKIKQKGHRGLN